MCALPSASALVGGMLAWSLGACLVAALGLAVEMLQLGGLLAGIDALWITAVQAVLLALMLKPMLAWRMLRDEVAGVEQALATSLPAGRLQLQRLVSRDVTHLDATTVRESAIETLAENLNDSVIATLFGRPWAACLRRRCTASPTRPTRWGYRGRYEWAGKWAARADDVLSWLPARLTAGLLVIASGRRLSWSSLRW